MHEASAELSRLPILIDDHPMTSMDRVRSSARLLKSKNRCDMVIVDYLQLCDMRSDQKNRNREQEVAQASRKAKLLAKELDIPVLLLSQLNRASDGSIDHRPTPEQPARERRHRAGCGYGNAALPPCPLRQDRR